ncbi:MAG: hypothetical protein IJ678_00095 [Kiritimatiellae bacterium]|nr:hypothetical protein [Kiritimatiellia bacterium]MBR1835976.1 hypothetical protein [Kiritimatiellia bacterium]
MSNAYPSRAAAALSPGISLALACGKRIVLKPFTPRRVAMLYDVFSPLFGDAPCGVAAGWIATLRVLAEPDAAALALQIALDGPAAFVAESGDWFETHPAQFEFGDVASSAEAIKAEWQRLCDLDRPDKPEGRPQSEAGEAPGPGTDGSLKSSAMPSAPGIGGQTPPSTAPSAS